MTKREKTARIKAAAPRLRKALAALLERCNGHLGMNPYCIPEFRDGLRVLADIEGIQDDLNVEPKKIMAEN